MNRFSLPWMITDAALAMLDEHLAQPVPERGAALLGPAGSRLVTDVLADPVEGRAAEYWHSDPLRHALNARLSEDPSVTYMGTAHSHPGEMAAPSEPDRRAFRSTLDANPQLRDLLFPIVVRPQRDQLSDVYLGDHLIGLPHGTLAAFTAVANGRRTEIAPVTVTVMPIREHADAIASHMQWATRTIRPIKGPAGLPWLQVDWETDDSALAAQMIVPQSYPLAAPLVRLADSAAFHGLPWQPGTSTEQIATYLRSLGAQPRDLAPHASPSQTPDESPSSHNGDQVSLRDAALARLSHHLPARAQWHVAVLGAGSVGSVAAEALARSGVSTITLVDPDIVEPANLSRTAYTIANIGEPKVSALAARLQAVAPGIHANPQHTPIDQWLNSDPLNGVDLILLATDDALAELDVNTAAYSQSIPMVSAKLFARADAGEILIIDPETHGPCLRCLTGSRAAPAGRSVNYGTGTLIAELALGPDIAVTAQRAAKICLALLSRGVGGPLADWITPMLEQQRVMLLMSNITDWEIFTALQTSRLGMDGPYQSIWIPFAQRREQRSCELCGTANPAPQPLSAAELDFRTLIPDPTETDRWPGSQTTVTTPGGS